MTTGDGRGAVVLLGCGRLGSALVEGWLKSAAFPPADLIVLTPHENAATAEAETAGAHINPPLKALQDASVLVLAVKPGKWREATEPLLAHLSAEAVVISLMAGVPAAQLAQAFADRPLARVMPTTGVAQAQGVASIWSPDAAASTAASRLFEPVATVLVLEHEALIDVATAVSGSGQGFILAFAQALSKAAEAAGLDAETAAQMARATLVSAAAVAKAEDRSLDEMIAQVASPGGTTEAGLGALSQGNMDALVQSAVQAAMRRAGELS